MIAISIVFCICVIVILYRSVLVTNHNVPLRDIDLDGNFEVPQTNMTLTREVFVENSELQSAFGQYSFYADVYKRNESERLIIVRPINWYVYSVDDVFYYLTYVAGHKCLPNQCSTITLRAIDNWQNKKSTFVHGCLNVPQTELLNIFSPCNFYVTKHRVSLDSFFEYSEERSLTIVEVLNFLLKNEKL